MYIAQEDKSRNSTNRDYYNCDCDCDCESCYCVMLCGGGERKAAL